MVQLNEDVLFLILRELQSTLYSCLLTNKTWCKITIPILWKNPWKCLDTEKMDPLYKVIISHLSDEVKEQLKSNSLVTRKIPLFNYISFIRHLNFYKLERVCNGFISDEILKLFINSNTKFTHLYMPLQFNYQIHLIPGAENCFSELKSVRCSDSTIQTILEGLSRVISKSIKKLKVYTNNIYSAGFFKLIEAQKNLNDVCFTGHVITIGEWRPFYKALEESLIKHADTIQHLQITWWPITKILSHLINLISLKIISPPTTNYNCLENAPLPALRILKSYCVPSKSLASLIENTKGSLTEIDIDYRHEGYYKKRFILAICQNCPNLKYFKLFLNSSDISELERVLISCQYLDGLIINSPKMFEEDLNHVFRILTKSSPASLFKFKFNFSFISYANIKLFLDNWKGRHPMSLQTVFDISDQIKEYMMNGTVKKYDSFDGTYERFEGFEWI